MTAEWKQGGEAWRASVNGWELCVEFKKIAGAAYHPYVGPLYDGGWRWLATARRDADFVGQWFPVNKREEAKAWAEQQAVKA